MISSIEEFFIFLKKFYNLKIGAIASIHQGSISLFVYHIGSSSSLDKIVNGKEVLSACQVMKRISSFVIGSVSRNFLYLYQILISFYRIIRLAYNPFGSHRQGLGCRLYFLTKCPKQVYIPFFSSIIKKRSSTKTFLIDFQSFLNQIMGQAKLIIIKRHHLHQ